MNPATAIGRRGDGGEQMIASNGRTGLADRGASPSETTHPDTADPPQDVAWPRSALLEGDDNRKPPWPV